MTTLTIHTVRSTSEPAVEDYLTDNDLEATSERNKRRRLGHRDVRIISDEVDVGENGDHLHRRLEEQRRRRRQ